MQQLWCLHLPGLSEIHLPRSGAGEYEPDGSCIHALTPPSAEHLAVFWVTKKKNGVDLFVKSTVTFFFSRLTVDRLKSPEQMDGDLEPSRSTTQSSAPPKAIETKKQIEPPILFEGEIVYLSTAEEAERVAKELFVSLLPPAVPLPAEQKHEASSVEQKREVVAIGFDIEWRPSFQKGVPPHKAALLQLGTLDKTYLFHIWCTHSQQKDSFYVCHI